MGNSTIFESGARQSNNRAAGINRIEKNIAARSRRRLTLNSGEVFRGNISVQTTTYTAGGALSGLAIVLRANRKLRTKSPENRTSGRSHDRRNSRVNRCSCLEDFIICVNLSCNLCLQESIFGRPFVKRFALCYRSVVCPVCL